MNRLCLQSERQKEILEFTEKLAWISKQIPLAMQENISIWLWTLNTNLSLQYKNIIFLEKAGVVFSSLLRNPLGFRIAAGLSHCQGVNSHGRRYCISSSDKSNSIICNWRRKTDLSQALRAWRGFYPGERQVSQCVHSPPSPASISPWRQPTL